MNKKVMVLEDDADILDIYGTILSEEKIDSVLLDTPSKVLKRLSEGTVPDLLLMDLNFPEMSAKEFVQELRKNPKLDSLKIIVLSGDQEIAKISQDLEVFSYISKPCSLEAILEKVITNL